MATQTIDFSNIETVIKDGVNLTRIELDGTTVWESSTAGLLWIQQGDNIDGPYENAQLGRVVAISDSKDLIAVTTDERVNFNRPEILIFAYSGAYWYLYDTISYLGFEDSRFYDMKFVGTDLYYVHANNPTSSNKSHSLYIYDTVTRTTTGGLVGTNIANLSTSPDGNIAYMYQKGGGITRKIEITNQNIHNIDDEYNSFKSRIAVSNSGVVAFSDSSVTRDDNTFAGEVRVYDAQGIQKGSFLQGTESNAKFGSLLAISANGDRLAVAAADYVLLYDYDGSDWIQHTPAITYTFAGEASPADVWRLAANSDLTKMSIVFNLPADNIRSAVSYEYNGSSHSMIGQALLDSSNDLDRFDTISLSSDGETLVIGDYTDDSSGNNAGSAAVYALS